MIPVASPQLGLPEAISPHNSYWYWGYGHPADGPVIAVGYRRDSVESYWSDVTLAAVLGADGVAIDPEERGVPVWICRGQKLAWPELWRELRSFG